MMNSQLIVLKQVALSVLARRKKWVLLVSLLALCLALPVAYVMSKEPPRFRTHALILIESRPDRTPLFQEFSPFRPLAVQLAILNSRSLAESVIEALPRGSVEDLVQNPYDRDWVLEFQNSIRRLRGQEVVVESPQQRALSELQSTRIRFNAQGPSGIVGVQAEASTPRVALDIANTYIEVLLSRTRSFNVDDTKVMREYLEQQLAQVSQTFGSNQEQLRQFNLARGGVRVPAKNADTISRLGAIDSTLAEVASNKSMAQNRYNAMKAKLDSIPAPPPPGPRIAAAAAPTTSARVTRLRARLTALEGQLIDFQQQYTDEHPRVQSVKRQIGELQSELGDAVKESSSPVSAASVSTLVPSQDRAAFADTVAALETSIHSLSAQEEALRNQAATLRRDLVGLSKDELEFTRLSTETESSRRLSDVINEKLRAIKLREQGEMKVVKVIDPPSFPTPAINAKRLRFIGIAVGVAFLIGLGLPTAVEYFNRPVESEEDIRALLGVPVLAAVPRLNSGRAMFMLGSSADDAKQEDYFLFTEAFRRLRVEVQLLGREVPLRRLLIASSLPGEGKSTVVVNLGLAFGEVGKHVILADADFHRPTLHRTLKTPNTKGFSDLLSGTSELNDSMTAVADGVWVSPRGASPTALSRTGLGSRRLGEVLDRMAEEAEYVLVDSSPILLIPDNLHMAAAVDGVILVVHSGTTRPRDLLRTKELFDKTATPILGVVLNQVPVRKMSQYYAYYKHYRAYVGADSKS